MANTPFLFCGPCETRKCHLQAFAWCAVCQEGLCKECDVIHKASKLSKDHVTFGDELYPLLRPFLRCLTEDCLEHKRKFDFFCQTHSVLCCVSCVTDNHRQCTIKPVDDESHSSKRSSAFSQLQLDMTKTVENIESIKNSQTKTIKSLNHQKRSLENEIQVSRKSINDRLDKLEKSLMDELSTTEQGRSIEIAELLFDIDTKKQIIVDLQTIADCVKKLPTGTQSFLAIQKLNEKFDSEKQSLDSVLSRRVSETVNIRLRLNEKLMNFVSDLKTFGEVEVCDRRTSTSSTQSSTSDVEKKKLVMQSRTLESFDPNRVSLRTLKRIKCTKKKTKVPVDLRGCVILPDEKMLFADWSENKKLMMFNIDGTHFKDVGVTGKPYDITCLDGERIAVSFPEDNLIQIFDDVGANDYPIYQSIKMSDQCWGIFYRCSKLFVGCNGHKIQIINLSGTSERTIPAKVNTVYCVNADSDYVYYTDEINNSVYCCDFNGEELWKFHDPSLKYPCSVMCNRDGYVFVVGNISQNVLVISADGQQSKTLLGKLDSLDGPAGLCFNSKSSRLLVVLASFKGIAGLYDVKVKPRSLNLA